MGHNFLETQNIPLPPGRPYSSFLIPFLFFFEKPYAILSPRGNFPMYALDQILYIYEKIVFLQHVKFTRVS